MAASETQRDEWRERLFKAAPHLAAAIAFSAGALTLIAVALPALPLVRDLGAVDRFLEEFSNAKAEPVAADL